MARVMVILMLVLALGGLASALLARPLRVLSLGAAGAAGLGMNVALVRAAGVAVAVGLAAAGFFAAVFPGNLAQWIHHRDGFGLDTDTKRFVRLFFQPVLIAAALWSTGALRGLRK